MKILDKVFNLLNQLKTKIINIFNKKKKKNIEDFVKEMHEHGIKAIDISNQKILNIKMDSIELDFFKNIKNNKFNDKYIKTETNSFIIYSYNFQDYLNNPKILQPDLIESKPFFLNLDVLLDFNNKYLDNNELNSKSLNISKSLKSISNYDYFLKYTYFEILEFIQESSYGIQDITKINIRIWNKKKRF